MKRAKSIVSIAASIVTLFMSSCDSAGTVGYKPTVTGQSYELLVVGDQKVWKDSVGIRMKDSLTHEMPCMPQLEKFFDVSYTPTEGFTGILKPVRNILFYEIDPTMYTQSKIGASRDNWAETQAVLRITAPSKDSLEAFFNKNIELIRRFYINAENERVVRFFGKFRHVDYCDSVRKRFGAELIIPSSLTQARFEKDFAWFSNGNPDFTENIVIYRIPYNDESDFMKDNLLYYRDSVMKAYVGGPSEGSYMTTRYEIMPPVSTVLPTVDGKYSVEIRGLWRIEGDIMGGPFVSRSYLDPENKNIITVEAFVYRPNKSKRSAYRQLEAMISSVKFKTQEKQEQ